MAALIRTHGVLPRIASCQEARARATEPNRAFRSLARAIVFQQLNGAAAATIFGRVRSAVGAEDDETAMTPEAFARAKDEDLRACGLSARKLEYLRGLAARFSSGDDDDDDDGRRPALTDDALEAMSDEKTTATLLELKGIGEWSVHMFQMFYLNRPDVLPVKDFGVRQGMMIAYGLRDPPKEEKMREIAASWAPYKTLASMYMWAAADAAKASKGKKETPR
jgi:3-methyladenine DNA glycosylase/8-oxoguanine DNA glycosylase